MSLMLAVILQTAPTGQEPARTIDFDLRDASALRDPEAEAAALWRDAQCDRGDGEEIVVCARTADKARNALPRLGEKPAEPLLPVDGYLPVGAPRVDPHALDLLAAPPARVAHWEARLAEVRGLRP